MRRRTARQSFPLIAVAMLLGAATVTGCAASPKDGTMTSGGGSGEMEVPTDATDISEAVEASDVTETSEARELAPAPLVGADCLAGTWQMELDSFEASLEKLLRESGEIPAEMLVGMSVELDGGNYIRFDGGDLYTAMLDDYTMTMTFQGNKMVHHQNSAETATYGVEGDLSWISSPVSLYFEATMTSSGIAVTLNESDAAQVSVFGNQMTVPGVARELIDGAARFTCDGDSLTLYGDYDTTASYTRVPEGTIPRS